MIEAGGLAMYPHLALVYKLMFGAVIFALAAILFGLLFLAAFITELFCDPKSD